MHTEDRDLIGHGGGYPGYRTCTTISSKENVGVIVFANSLDAEVYPGSTWSITDRIFEWVAPAITKALTNDDQPTMKPEWESLVGSYRSIWTDAHVLFLDGKMSLINPNLPDPKESVLTLDPIAPTKFKLMGESANSGYHELGEEVSFEFGADGEMQQMKIGENYLRPISYERAQ